MENEFSLICMTDKQIFFYLFNRRSYAGDLELVKKKKKKVEAKKKRHLERMSGSACIRGCMWK